MPFPTNKSRQVSRNCDSVEIRCGFSLLGKMTIEESSPGHWEPGSSWGELHLRRPGRRRPGQLEAAGLLHRYSEGTAESGLVDVKCLQRESRQGTRTTSCFLVSWRKPQPADLCRGIVLALRSLSTQRARDFAYTSSPRGLSLPGQLNLHQNSDAE